MVAPDRLVILHAPCHAPDFTEATARLAMDLGADSADLSEAYRLADWLQHREDYACVVGRSSVDTRAVTSPCGDAGDNPILVRRSHRLISQRTEKACDPSEPRKIAPERWNGRATYAHPIGKVAHFSAHPNAAVHGLDPNHVDRVHKYAEQMALLRRRVRRAQSQGRLIVITGDMNHPEGGPAWAPGPTFNRLGLDTWRDGIDWVAYDKRLKLVDQTVIGMERTGQDHPWMLATFVAQ